MVKELTVLKSDMTKRIHLMPALRVCCCCTAVLRGGDGFGDGLGRRRGVDRAQGQLAHPVEQDLRHLRQVLPPHRQLRLPRPRRLHHPRPPRRPQRLLPLPPQPLIDRGIAGRGRLLGVHGAVQYVYYFTISRWHP
jgi:hypothetical protein